MKHVAFLLSSAFLLVAAPIVIFLLYKQFHKLANLHVFRLLASLFEKKGWFDKALPLRQKNLVFLEKRYGKTHFELVDSLNALGDAYIANGLTDDALPLYQRALAILEKKFGTDHPSIVDSLNNVADTYRLRGRHADSLPLYQRANDILENTLDKQHPGLTTSLHNLAGAYHGNGQYDLALPLYEKALKMAQTHFGAKDDRALTIAAHHALCAQKTRLRKWPIGIPAPDSGNNDDFPL